MKIMQLQTFLMVADTGSFTVAAEELYISQSSLSKQIIALEKELGVVLFDRSRRHIALTPAGEIFRQHARTLHDAYLTMAAELATYRAEPAVAMLSIPVIAQYGIPAYLAEFKKAYPHFGLTLEEREPRAIFRALNTHTADLAVVRDHYLDLEKYAALAIAQDTLLVAVSKNHRLAERASVSLAELADEGFIVYDRSTLLDEFVEDACRQAGFEPRIVYATLRIESILGLVASNTGIALVMNKVFDHSRHHNVVGVPLNETIVSNVVLAWLRDKKLSKPAETFVDLVRKMQKAGGAASQVR